MPHAICAQLPSGTITVSATASPGFTPAGLLGFASRLNPKRAFLFVSKVLGKHIPVPPAMMKKTHQALAVKLAPMLKQANNVLVLGFAETATGLGAGVFEAVREHCRLPLLYVQTTRYDFNSPRALEFKEEHSHATSHLVFKPKSSVFHQADTLVLVDDEYTTGKTCLNFLRSFLETNPHVRRVALVSLVNWMTKEHRAAFKEAFADIHFSYVNLLSGYFSYEACEGHQLPPAPHAVGNGALKDDLVQDQRGCARFGQDNDMHVQPHNLPEQLAKDKVVRVVGDGELMHLAFKTALALEAAGYRATVQSTSRSPILVSGCISSALQFNDHYGDGIINYLYNPPEEGDQVLVVHETEKATALCEQLTQRGCQVVTRHVRELL